MKNQEISQTKKGSLNIASIILILSTMCWIAHFSSEGDIKSLIVVTVLGIFSNITLIIPKKILNTSIINELIFKLIELISVLVALILLLIYIF